MIMLALFQNKIWIFMILYSTINCAYIEKNAYKGVTISFSENAFEDTLDLLKFKDVLKNASDLLFHATKNRSYFEDFVLVVPETWTDNNKVCDEFTTEAPKNVDIYFTDSVDSSVLKAQHSRGCAEKGDIIYVSKGWLTSNIEENLALEFIQQWSVYRYGVFSENPEQPGSCISTSESTWSPTGCYNIDLEVPVRFDDENGLPTCYLPDNFNEQKDLLSSLMFSKNSSKELDFCDGLSFPHNPVAPTLHNRICEGDPVWSVIKNTEDFLYGRNSPMKIEKLTNKPTFRCFKESKTHLTIVVQDSDSEARTEIRYALLHFLSVIDPANFAVSLATFSSDVDTKDSDFKDVSLEDKKKLKTDLDSYLTLNEKIPNPCLICGIRKAFKVSETSPYSPRTIVLLARESSLKSSKPPEIIDIIQKNENTLLYLLFFEDTESDIIPSSFVDAIENTSGRIFRVKNNPVFMLTELTTALLDASKSNLHVEDKILVVHKKTYMNVKSNISDIFLTPKNTKGKLLYSMQCEKRGDLKNINDTCSDMDIDLQSPICGSETEINDNENYVKVWKHSFRYVAGSEGTTCSSLALLKLKSPIKNSFTVKGWLNENKITPGYNALVIYAEIYGSLERDVQVYATISGPGLEEFKLELRDNGNGDPDVIKGDKIYSRYFTSFNQKGTYTVTVHAESLVEVKNSLYAEENITKEENSGDMMIIQTKVIGTFRVMQAPPMEDILPPNRVSDLKVVSIDHMNRTALIQWTAPGDDYDNGRATKYTIKRSDNWITLKYFTLNLKENIVMETGEQPAMSGTIENIRILCPLTSYTVTYYIALLATDDNDNSGKVSNIIQIPFKEYYFPSSNSIDTSTKTSNNYDITTVSDSTETSTKNVILTDSTTMSYENTTVIINQTIDGIFIEKKTFIIATSSLGVLIFILIILIIILCYCCCKKRYSEKPKKLSKRASLRPPYNLNISYKRGSETSLEDNVVSHSSSALVDQQTTYSGSDGRPEKRYSYHTGRSLKNKMELENAKDDLGFKLVKPMPLYATSSLSRFATGHLKIDNEDMSSNVRSDSVQLSEDTHIYPLGQV